MSIKIGPGSLQLQVDLDQRAETQPILEPELSLKFIYLYLFYLTKFGHFQFFPTYCALEGQTSHQHAL